MQFYGQVLACMLTSADHPDEWHDNGTKEDEERFTELFQARAADEARPDSRRHRSVRVATDAAGRTCRGMRAGTCPDRRVVGAQIVAGMDYFSRRWGNYSQWPSPLCIMKTCAACTAHRGMVTNYPAKAVIKHMAYIAERSRFDAGTQTALMRQQSNP